jgi:hypothetical protein
MGFVGWAVVLESLLAENFAGNFPRRQVDLIESKHFYVASSKSCSGFPAHSAQGSCLQGQGIRWSGQRIPETSLPA